MHNYIIIFTNIILGQMSSDFFNMGLNIRAFKVQKIAVNSLSNLKLMEIMEQ